MKNKILIGILIGVVTTGSCTPAYASKLSDAETTKAEAESNLNTVNSTISDLEYQEALLQADIDGIDTELVSVLLNLDIIETDIANIEIELAAAEADLAVAKITEQEQYEAMKLRIQYMYENGDTTYLTALLGADSFADVLNKVEAFGQIYDYDRQLLIEYYNTKVEVETLVATVEEEKSELEETQADYETQQSNLETLKAEKRLEMDDFDTQLAEAALLAAQYKTTIDEQNSIIATELAAAQARQAAQVTAGAASITPRATFTTTQEPSYAPQNSGNQTAVSAPVTPTAPTTSSSVGASAAAYACQFVGNPYVWGGASLTNGADCSGFIMAVYANYGISLPHYSDSLAGVGRPVSASELQPGDIIVYSGHCAIYIGGGAIVHASNAKDGIKISPNYAYRTIIAMRRVG